MKLNEGFVWQGSPELTERGNQAMLTSGKYESNNKATVSVSEI